MNNPKKVHIVDASGRRLYNFLYDTGGAILKFDSGYGFIDRLDIKRFRWKIVDGWY